MIGAHQCQRGCKMVARCTTVGVQEATMPSKTCVAVSNSDTKKGWRGTAVPLQLQEGDWKRGAEVQSSGRIKYEEYISVKTRLNIKISH